MVRDALERIYGAVPDTLVARLERAFGPAPPEAPFTAADTVLITYGDSIRSPGEPPLRTLGRFVDTHLEGAVGTVHVLPFSPSSSDDGFAVIDYGAVDVGLGTWADIGDLAAGRGLMVDLVINHISQEHVWFSQFLAGKSPGRDAILTALPGDDLTAVTRPRTHQLLRPVVTVEGERHVWCTFSHDQIDVDFSNPDVLAAYVETAADYARRGATTLRLDAIAYLWKEIGTSCIHRPQTHDIVKLLRSVSAGHCKIITETNVPHAENISYFGAGDEAHAVYNFALPPLLIDAFCRSDAGALAGWLGDLEPAPLGGAYLNFLASHDGIGLRPVEGLLAAEHVAGLVQRCLAVGGSLSSFASPEGAKPYELNVALIDVLGGTPQLLAAHAAMVAMAGVPAVYVHSFLGTRNDYQAVAERGHNRAINRGHVDLAEFERSLADSRSETAQLLPRLRHILATRRIQPAFDPSAQQSVLPAPSTVLAFDRRGGGQSIVVAVNLSADPQSTIFTGHDLLTDASFDGRLDPYQAVWLVEVD